MISKRFQGKGSKLPRRSYITILDGFFASFHRPDSNNLINRYNKDSSVTNLFGTGRTNDGIHGPLNSRVGNHDFKFHFWHENAVIFASRVGSRVPFLTPKPFDFGNSHPLDSDLGQGIPYFIHFEWLNDCLDLLHLDQASNI